MDAGLSSRVGRRALTVLALVVLASFGLLQVRLSYLAWTQVRYSSRYFEQLGMQMGYLADHPDAELECLPLLTLCKFPIEARKRIMGLLVRERLNVFSPGFQTFHRLYPDRGAAPPEPDFAH